MNSLVGNIVEVKIDERLRDDLGEDGYNFLYRFAFNNGHRVLHSHGIAGVTAVSKVICEDDGDEVSFTVTVKDEL